MNYTIKNFRVFNDQNGGTFDINDITLLTGCNGAGKSSLVKSMQLMSDLFAQFQEDIKKGYLKDLSKYELRFNKGDHKLGTFKRAKNKNCLDSDFIVETNHIFYPLCIRAKVEYVFTDVKGVYDVNAHLKTVRVWSGDSLLYDSAENYLNYKELIPYVSQSIKEISLKRTISDCNSYEQFEERGLLPVDCDSRVSCKQYDAINDLYSNVHQGSFTVAKYNGLSKKLLSKLKMVENKDGTLKFNKSIQPDVLFEAAILDVLDGVDKKDVKKELQEVLINRNQGKKCYGDFNKIQPIIDAICDDYIASEYSTFKEYFLKLQEIYLQTAGFNLLNKYTVNQKPDYSGLSSAYSTSAWEAFSCINNRQGMFTKQNDVPYNNKKNNEQFYSILSLDFFLDSKNIDFRFIHDIQTDIIYYESVELFYSYIADFLRSLITKTPDIMDNITRIDVDRAHIERLYLLDNPSTAFTEMLSQYMPYYAQKLLDKEYKINIVNRRFDILYPEYIINIEIEKKSKGLPRTLHDPTRGMTREAMLRQEDPFDVQNSFINRWLQKFEIADSIEFEFLKEGSGVYIYLRRGEEKTLLADEGYGILQLVSMLLNIELIIGNKKDKENHLIAIEEPESNLHPRFQSMLADVLLDVYRRYNIHFIIETHSEYLLKKFQYFIAKDKELHEKISLHYVYGNQKNKASQDIPDVDIIPFTNEGHLEHPLGSGFLDETDNLSMDILMANIENHE